MTAAITGVTDVAQRVTDSNKTKSAIEEQQDRFIKLLITQMKNQDPLNPLDNAQITMQMAQISTVQGIEKLNATLQALNRAQSFQAVSMIGHSVLVPGDFVNLKGGMAIGGMDLATAADKVKVSVVDANGVVVRELLLGKREQGSSLFAWDGKTTDGLDAPEGSYSFRIDATLNGSNVDATSLALGEVSSVLMDKSGLAAISVSGMGLVDLAQVRQIM